MKNFDYDYNKFDKITIFVQKDKMQEIINYYNLLKWELKDNKRYKNSTDLVELSFLRPHIIKEKDRLQLYQVQLEHILNKMGILEKLQYTKTTSFCISLGIFSIVSIIIALLMFLQIISTQIALPIFLLSIGIILIICNFIFTFKIKSYETKEFNLKHKNLDKALKTLISYIKSITEDAND